MDAFVFIYGPLLYDYCGSVLEPSQKEVGGIKVIFSFDFIIAEVSLRIPEEFILEGLILLTVY